jgi:hypothetical protein
MTTRGEQPATIETMMGIATVRFSAGIDLAIVAPVLRVVRGVTSMGWFLKQ